VGRSAVPVTRYPLPTDRCLLWMHSSSSSNALQTWAWTATSPPDPRPSDVAKAPSRSPRGGAFLLGARPELCSGKWSVQKEAAPRFQPCSDDTLPLSYVPHLPPSPVRARGSCTAPSRSAVSPHLQCGDSRTPAIPRRDAQNFRGRWQKNACELAYRASARCATTRRAAH
jgi:hypothetical protein